MTFITSKYHIFFSKSFRVKLGHLLVIFKGKKQKLKCVCAFVCLYMCAWMCVCMHTHRWVCIFENFCFHLFSFHSTHTNEQQRSQRFAHWCTDIQVQVWYKSEVFRTPAPGSFWNCMENLKSITRPVCVGGVTLTFPGEGPQLLAFFIILFHLTCLWDLDTKGPGEQGSPNSRDGSLKQI